MAAAGTIRRAPGAVNLQLDSGPRNAVREGPAPDVSRDVFVLTEGRRWRRWAAGSVLCGSAADDPEVLLLIEGSAAVSAETPFGPHPLTRVEAPSFLTLHRALTGSLDLCRFEPADGATAVAFTAAEARALLFATDTRGQAFRRLALLSVTPTLRSVNASLKRFFDGLGSKEEDARRRAAPPAPAERAAVDPSRVHDLFDAAGLDTASLPHLGLTARTVPAGAALMAAGESGDEAYLVAEGRLRVSIRIPGVGEEALAFLGPGEIVGEMALVDDAPRSADVVAHDGSALVFALSRDVFRRLLASGAPEGAGLLGGIVVVLARRFEEAVQKAATFRVLSGPF